MSNFQGEGLRLQKWRGKIWAGNLAFVVRDLSTKRFVCKYLTKKLVSYSSSFQVHLWRSEWFWAHQLCLHTENQWTKEEERIRCESPSHNYHISSWNTTKPTYLVVSRAFLSYPKDYLAIHICHVCFSVLVARILKHKRVIEGDDLHLSCQTRTGQASL